MFREATAEDWATIWPYWQRIVAAGETYTYRPDTDEPTARRLWMQPPPARVYVNADASATALLKPNQSGPGDHVANAGFMVDPAAAGRGLGRRLAEFVLQQAGEQGYEAMQFNAVVETNRAAVALWRSLGFEILTTVPRAFRHPEHGYVGLHVMHRAL